MPRISRRVLLAGAAATPVGGAGDEGDPMEGLCRAWHAAWRLSERRFGERVRLHRDLMQRGAEAEGGLALAEALEAEADARLDAAMRAVLEGSAVSLRGVVAKLEVAVTFGAGQDDLPWDFLREALADLRRLV